MQKKLYRKRSDLESSDAYAELQQLGEEFLDFTDEELDEVMSLPQEDAIENQQDEHVSDVTLEESLISDDTDDRETTITADDSEREDSEESFMESDHGETTLTADEIGDQSETEESINSLDRRNGYNNVETCTECASERGETNNKYSTRTSGNFGDCSQAVVDFLQRLKKRRNLNYSINDIYYFHRHPKPTITSVICFNRNQIRAILNGIVGYTNNINVEESDIETIQHPTSINKTNRRKRYQPKKEFEELKKLNSFDFYKISKEVRKNRYICRNQLYRAYRNLSYDVKDRNEKEIPLKLNVERSRLRGHINKKARLL